MGIGHLREGMLWTHKLVDMTCGSRTDEQHGHVICYALFGVSCEQRNDAKQAHAVCYELFREF